MMRQMLKAKLHRARVTASELDYPGSIAIDRELIELANILPNEKVDVYNITNGNRLSTYVIEGEPGAIIINGAAAHLANPGDIVIICSYVLVDDAECRNFKATVLYLDENNRVSRLEKK